MQAWRVHELGEPSSVRVLDQLVVLHVEGPMGHLVSEHRAFADARGPVPRRADRYTVATVVISIGA